MMPQPTQNTTQKFAGQSRRMRAFVRYRINKPGDAWHGPTGRVDYDLQLKPNTSARGFTKAELIRVK